MRIFERMKLDGRVALVTGSKGHFGRVICETLHELGAKVVGVDKEDCDLESEAERKQLITKIRSDYQNLSILVHNAAFVGTSDLKGWSAPFEMQNLETWRRALEVNLSAVFDLTQGLLPLMRGAPGANIINIASIYAQLGPDWSLYDGTSMGNPAAYAASKGGLLQMTRWLATTLAPDMRVNAITPGGILRSQPESFIKKYTGRVPMRRMATEQDMAGAIAYLASDASSYVTGQNICVDGGFGSW